jgi:hypothetical protein
MAHDPDMHAFATRFPDAILALLGLPSRGAYTVESVEVKTSRRIDLVFTPQEPDDPWIRVEWQASPDPAVERRALTETAVHCLQRGAFDDTEVAIIYADQACRDAALSADMRHGERVVTRFMPIRVVLTEIDPDALLALGGPALLALPLVGTEERVVRDSPGWLKNVREAACGAGDVAEATRLFLKFVTWRLGTMPEAPLASLKEVLMKGTVAEAFRDALKDVPEVREMLAQERVTRTREAVATVIVARLGAAPEWLASRLDGITELPRLERLLASVARIESLAELEAALA